MIKTAELTPTETEVQSEDYLFPCSVVQRTCWYLDRISPGTPANNIAVRFRLEGALDVCLLEHALKEVILRHEVLRTRFISEDGEPKQLVEAEAKFSLPLVDLRRLPEEERRSEAERLSSEEARLGFNIESGPLFRGKLIQLADREFMLLLTLHHIVSDGWSIGVLTDEMGQFYEMLAEGTAPKLDPLTLQYADYSCWQQEWMNSGELGQKLSDLKNRLDDFCPISIPTDFERPALPVSKGEIRSAVLPRSLTDQLKTLSDQRGCTLFVTMLSAFGILMAHESSQTDLAIRTQVSGRDQMELESLIGWFVNSIILRIDASGDPSFSDLVERSRRIVLESFEYQQVPFERVMEAIRPKLNNPRQLPFQVNFIFQRDFVRPWERSGIKMTAIPSKSTGTFVDLNFFLVERKDGWRASVDVNTDVFAPETGDALLNKFTKVLEAVAENPQVRLSELVMPSRQRPAVPVGKASAFPREEHIPGKTHYEIAVIEIWERVLNRRPIGVLSNFFDLGGHSLNAVRMLVELRERFGMEIKLSQLFVDPTPRAMAKVISGEGAPRDDRDIIPVQPNGARPAFFMIGGDHFYRPLAKSLGDNQPFLVVPLERYRTPEMEDSFTVPLGKERPRVARDLAALLIKQYGHGPFYLGGWCADGVTAFETARAIEEQGGAVGMVALFDAPNPKYLAEARALAASTARRMASLRSTLKSAFDDGLMRSGGVIAKGVGEFVTRACRRMFSVYSESYEVVPVSFPVLVLAPPVTALHAPDLGWGQSCKGTLDIVNIPGDHESIFKDPNVKIVGRRLREHLDIQMGSTADRAPLGRSETDTSGS
jgi:thioesterase domain-containing protein/acyl carrier protein